MPSSSVSVSPISVSVSISPSRPAAAGSAAAVESDAGFQQWMNNAQNRQRTSGGEGGDPLPSEGKDLPAQRQEAQGVAADKTPNGDMDKASGSEAEKSHKGDVDNASGGETDLAHRADADKNPAAEADEAESGDTDKAQRTEADNSQNDASQEIPRADLSGASDAVSADDVQKVDGESSALTGGGSRTGQNEAQKVAGETESKAAADSKVGDVPDVASKPASGVDLPEGAGKAAESQMAQAQAGAAVAQAANEPSVRVSTPTADAQAPTASGVSQAGTGKRVQDTEQAGDVGKVASRERGDKPQSPEVVGAGSRDSANDRSHISAEGRSIPEPPPLPEQAARPEVREAALENGRVGPQQTQSAPLRGDRLVAEMPGTGAQSDVEAVALKSEAPSAAPAAIDGAGGDVAQGRVEQRNVEQGNVGTAVQVGQAEQVVEGHDTAAAAQLAAQSQPVTDSDPSIEQVRPLSARDTVAQAVERNTDMGTAAKQPGDGSAQIVAQSAQSPQQGAARAQSDQLLSRQAQQLQSGGQPAQSADTDQNGQSSKAGGALFTADSRSGADPGGLGAQSQQQNSATTQPGVAAQRFEASAAALAQRLQDPAWGRAMGQRAVMMAQYGPRSAEIQLDPPELGAMQVRVHLNGKDQVSVSFTSPHPQVREAIEQQLPRLKEMFAEQGMDLNQSSVSDQSAREQRDESGGERGRQSGSQAYGDSGSAGESLINVTQAPVGLVDYYA